MRSEISKFQMRKVFMIRVESKIRPDRQERQDAGGHQQYRGYDREFVDQRLLRVVGDPEGSQDHQAKAQEVRRSNEDVRGGGSFHVLHDQN